MVNEKFLDEWAMSVLADPLTKKPKDASQFPSVREILDCRVTLSHSIGYQNWNVGQGEFEDWEVKSFGYADLVKSYCDEINYDREVYEHFQLVEPILDVGGYVGVIREFLPSKIKFLSVDPFISAPYQITQARREAYKCLAQPLNFIGAMAEFLPIRDATFNTVHMRSMLDHVHIPDLAILEAKRVLAPGGNLIVGISLEGAPFGRDYSARDKGIIFIKNMIKRVLSMLGFKKWHDHHMWHPTLENLNALLSDNGFLVGEPYWQKKYLGRVVYLEGIKPLT